jgi:DNA-binding response OmpR family regulator
MDPPTSAPAKEPGNPVVKLDPELRQAIVDGLPVALSTTEFAVLALLLSRPGKLFTREEILVGVHRHPLACTPGAVNFQVHRLRKKLGAAAACLETVRGAGFRFQA